MIYNADSIVKLKELKENSIDSIVCDPPYELTSVVKRFGKKNSKPQQYGTDGLFQRASKGFMGKAWDATGIAENPDFWKECLRVLKPGGHLLAFGHSRTHHRMFVAVEDAGFQIKDTIMWLYAQGFPKSHNIGKSVDALRKTGKSNPKSLKEVEQKHGGKSYKLKGKNNGIMGETVEWERKEYQTETGWEGWGTALKPSHETICLAQKPREGTYAKNVLKHGVGGLNIDACRVGSDKVEAHHSPKGTFAGGEPDRGSDKNYYSNTGRFPANLILSHSEDCKLVGTKVDTRDGGNRTKTCHNGKEPISGGEGSGGKMKETTLVDTYECVDGCPIKELDEQSGITKGTRSLRKNRSGMGIHDSPKGTFGKGDVVGGFDDKGGASRFFYCAKSGKKERNKYMPEDAPLKSAETRTPTGAGVYAEKGFNPPRRNHHPTIKPLRLMEYLIRLITPPGGTVLDPFMGSGSTGIAAIEGGWKFVGIEKDKEYYEIAKARLQNCEEQNE